MPTAAHTAAPRTLALGDYDGAIRGALIGHLGSDALSRYDFIEIMDAPTDPARLTAFDLVVGIGRHWGELLRSAKL